MKCRSCSAEIADKAIVCYKCGTPTALPPAPVRPALPAAGARVWLPLVLLVPALVSGFLAYQAETALGRWAAITAGLALLATAGVWRARNRPRPGVRVH